MMLSLEDDYGYRAKGSDYIEKPFFHDLSPDFAEIESKAKRYRKFKRIILVGNGGAVNSFSAIHRALYEGDKQITVINSMEPDLLRSVKKKNPPKDTLCIVSSTSGTNVGVLEIMSQLLEYPMFVMTADNDGALKAIALNHKIDRIFVPHFVDRFQTSSGLAYFPLALLGIDVAGFDSALHAAYESCFLGGPAKELSSILYQLERKGYNEVFLPIYSSKLEGFALYITQLMHESACKAGKGQTFLVVNAPESQHHTNQRFFGGRKDMCGLFMRVSEQVDQTSMTVYPKTDESIKLRAGTVGSINRQPLAKSFESEYLGTRNDALANRIPVGTVSLDRITKGSVAELVAFWHYMAVYSSHLRGVNPFDQPQVEKSKEISFGLRAGNA
jgi:glucose-6-phosphate isomerase